MTRREINREINKLLTLGEVIELLQAMKDGDSVKVCNMMFEHELNNNELFKVKELIKGEAEG